MLQGIEVTNFRNHREASFPLGPLTAIIGPNGSGKTSLLEAVSLLSVAGSWKTERDSEVISWDAPFARIVGDSREFVIQRDPAYKRFRIDGVSKRLVDVLGTLPSVIFQPEDSELVFGSPAYRRRLLDRLLSQVVPTYARSLITLQKVLRQRNRLLKQIQDGMAGEEELVYWDNELTQASLIIQEARAAVLGEMSLTVSEQFALLVPQGEEVTLQYHRSPAHLLDDSMNAHLAANRSKEIAAGTSLYGPHREDIVLHYAGHPAAECMSRGQARALVLAVKLAEVHYIEQQTGNRPILLLDDVFAEFDTERRERIAKLCENYQALLTATEPRELETGSLGKVSYIQLGS